MNPDEQARATSDAVDAWRAANPAPEPPHWAASMSGFSPVAERVEVTYCARRRQLASALTQFANLTPDSEADRERTASGWPWGAWWLYVRAGVHFEDRGAVKDRYEVALGWAKTRGTARDMRTLGTFTDAVTEAYGGFPDGWPRMGR